LPGLLIGCVAALAVTVLLLRRSILTEKLARRGHHITREYSIDVFELLRVREVMDENPPTIPATMKVGELSDRIARNDPELSRRQGTLIVDGQRRLVGIITRGDLVRALQRDRAGRMTVLEAGARDPIVAYPDEVLHDAVAKMLKNNIGRLPVVSRDDGQHIVGYLGRGNVMAARVRHLEDEDVRERSQISELLPLQG